MPTVEWNKLNWDGQYDWPEQGDEWSITWGGVDMQWFGCIYPRIHNFVPAKMILEIAPGFGRWTQFLVNHCEKLVLVDLSAKCIERCKERFRGHSHVDYHVNDGASLEMVPDDSVDLAFSFDSLVHVEDAVMKEYIRQLAKKLTPNGVGFIHHSNLGEYRDYFTSLRKIGRMIGSEQSSRGEEGGRSSSLQKPGLLLRTGIVLKRLGWLDYEGARAISMTAAKFEEYAREAGLQCMSQEVINWGTRRLIDCISVFVRKGSRYARLNRILRNPQFMDEAQHIRAYATLYGAASFKK